ncbi:hypothetical protein T4A_6679 [Trichinella pseudospiralis]|uniref:PiggyBac transposable element-derived protein domain-containing protein n=1 Tax=Trichinella pseudospiralis TaxID=6337 RepID=A0A0V1E8X5_TRIPS|nr:hypothetical protein T4A_6679 [Trichinella pseudospiralis]
MDNNQKLPIGNKMSKVTLLYSLLNASLVQYGIYHEQLSINESIVPYLCRHGTKIFECPFEHQSCHSHATKHTLVLDNFFTTGQVSRIEPKEIERYRNDMTILHRWRCQNDDAGQRKRGAFDYC